MPATPNKGYEVQATGGNSGTWGEVLNDDVFTILDNNLGSTTTKSLSNSNVVLTAEESQSLVLRLTGILTGAVQITTSCVGMTICENVTTGAFAVTLTDGTGAVTLPQGARSVVITGASQGARIAADIFPTGTSMFFAQTAAPTGWTKDTSNYNEHAIRIVTGSASNGGSVNFTTAFMSQTPGGTVGNTTLTIDQIPAHTHTYAACDNEATHPTGTGGTEVRGQVETHNTSSTGGGQSHTHSFTGNAMNLAVKYLDCILAVKD